jgi:23S rRNA (pseudouridine1915-N3)-methyltransferase
MKWQIAAIGRPALSYAKAGVAEYLKRLGHYASIEVTFLKDNDPARMEKLRKGAVCVVLDERGEEWTTAQFEKRIEGWESDGAIKRVLFCIGGADGHDGVMRENADAVLSLSRFTMQHELALVVFLEQLYRVFTMKRGEPYHRP